jgi:anthranilate synthase
MGFVDPPLALVARGREARPTALNERGCALIPAIARAFRALSAVAWDAGVPPVRAAQLALG